MYESYSSGLLTGLVVYVGFVWLIAIALSIVLIIAQWKLFEKAGEHGWAVLVPLYNTYVLFKIAFGNGWKFLLLLVPFVNIVFAIMVWFKLAAAFGKDVGYGFGLWLLNPIFMMILGFGKAEYIGVSY